MEWTLAYHRRPCERFVNLRCQMWLPGIKVGESDRVRYVRRYLRNIVICWTWMCIAYFATVVAPKVGGRFHDLQGSVTVIGIFGCAMFQVETTFKWSIILRPLARNPLVHGDRVVPKEPLDDQTLPFMRGQRIFAIEHDRSATIFYCGWNSDRCDAYSFYTWK